MDSGRRKLSVAQVGPNRVNIELAPRRQDSNGASSCVEQFVSISDGKADD